MGKSTDVGAGGLSNALPELLHDTNLGSVFELRDIDNADSGMRYIKFSQLFYPIMGCVTDCETYFGSI